MILDPVVLTEAPVSETCDVLVGVTTVGAIRFATSWGAGDTCQVRAVGPSPVARLLAVTSVKVRIAPSPLTIPMAVPSAHGQTGLRIDHTVNRSQTRPRHAGQQEGSLRFDTRVTAVTYQGAVDTMIPYLVAHPRPMPTPTPTRSRGYGIRIVACRAAMARPLSASSLAKGELSGAVFVSGDRSQRS